MGVPYFGGPCNKDPTISFGYYIGIPYFWKLPYRYVVKLRVLGLQSSFCRRSYNTKAL